MSGADIRQFAERMPLAFAYTGDTLHAALYRPRDVRNYREDSPHTVVLTPAGERKMNGGEVDMPVEADGAAAAREAFLGVAEDLDAAFGDEAVLAGLRQARARLRELGWGQEASR